MDYIPIFSIILSLIAVIVSIISYSANKAVTNQHQVQNNYSAFCSKLQDLIVLGQENNIMSFKYDIENVICFYQNNDEEAVQNNLLEKSFGIQKATCKRIYFELIENLDFFRSTNLFSDALKQNQFDNWISKTINTYFKDLDCYYGDLSDINTMARMAKKGLQSIDEDEKIDSFYNNIREIIKYSQILQIVKRQMVGTFGSISVKKIHLFKNNYDLIQDLKKALFSWIVEKGIDEAINKDDYGKIKMICLDFGEQYDSFITEEKKDHKEFLNQIRRKYAQDKT